MELHNAKLKLTPITVEDLKNCETGEYNRQVWLSKIERFLKNNATFYVVPKGNGGYEYDRHFVKYTIEEGITFFSPFTMSSSITNNGFCKVIIDENHNVFTQEFSNGKTTGCLVNNAENRKLMADMSRKYDTVFTSRI